MLTTNVDAGGAPNSFSLAILDSGNALPIAGLGAVGADLVLTVDIDSEKPAVCTFAADPFRSPFITMTAPVVTADRPEPGSIWLLAAGGGLLIALRRRGRA